MTHVKNNGEREHTVGIKSIINVYVRDEQVLEGVGGGPSAVRGTFCPHVRAPEGRV